MLKTWLARNPMHMIARSLLASRADSKSFVGFLLKKRCFIAFVKEDNVGRLLICSCKSFHRLMVDEKKLLRYDSVLAWGMTKLSPSWFLREALYVSTDTRFVHFLFPYSNHICFLDYHALELSCVYILLFVLCHVEIFG